MNKYNQYSIPRNSEHSRIVIKGAYHWAITLWVLLLSLWSMIFFQIESLMTLTDFVGTHYLSWITFINMWLISVLFWILIKRWSLLWWFILFAVHLYTVFLFIVAWYDVLPYSMLIFLWIFFIWVLWLWNIYRDDTTVNLLDTFKNDYQYRIPILLVYILANVSADYLYQIMMSS